MFTVTIFDLNVGLAEVELLGMVYGKSTRRKFESLEGQRTPTHFTKLHKTEVPEILDVALETSRTCM